MLLVVISVSYQSFLVLNSFGQIYHPSWVLYGYSKVIPEMRYVASTQEHWVDEMESIPFTWVSEHN